MNSQKSKHSLWKIAPPDEALPEGQYLRAFLNYWCSQEQVTLEEVRHLWIEIVK